MDFYKLFKENKILRKNGTINKGALDRYILSKNIVLKNLIYDHTNFLDSSLNNSYDRVFAILHSVVSPKHCSGCVQELKLTSSTSFCSIRCFNTNEIVKKRRNETILKIDPNTGISKAKLIGQKGAQTKKALDEFGSSISKRAGKKLSETLSKIDPVSGSSFAKIRGKKLSEILTKIDKVSGKSIAQVRGEKLSEALNTILDCGISESQRRSRLALRTMKSTIDSITGMNHSQLRSYKCALSKEANGRVISSLGGLKDDFKKYRSNVLSFTFQNNLSILSNFEKRSNHASNKDAYHLDHKFSVLEGFKQNIPPEVIGNICNLQMLPWIDNIKKGSNSSLTKEQLLLDYEKINSSSQGTFSYSNLIS